MVVVVVEVVVDEETAFIPRAVVVVVVVVFDENSKEGTETRWLVQRGMSSQTSENRIISISCDVLRIARC